MDIDDQIKDEKLRYNINREAAKISALSSGEIRKYEYLTGKDILPSNQQQIIEQAKFTYSPLGKAFNKQIKTIKDQGEKQVEALDNLKLKEETKHIKDTPNNKAIAIFNELINERKEIMNKLYDRVDYNNLTFKYVSPTKDVIFYEYMNSKDLFNAIISSQIKFIDSRNKQNEILNKLKNIKIGRKTMEQEKVINNIEKFYISREEVINFFRDYTEMLSNANYKVKQNETKGTGLKILTPKQMLQ